MTPEKALAGMRRAGLRPEVFGGQVILMAGSSAVRDVWRPLLRRHHDAIRALLVQTPGPRPAQMELGGKR